MHTYSDNLGLLRLLQLADSALPIGSAAHSFGLETLVATKILAVEQLELFLNDYMQEAGRLECAFLRLGHQMGTAPEQGKFMTDWAALNGQLSAIKTARESRNASITLGRRFLQLAYELTAHPLLSPPTQAARRHKIDVHYCIAFGLVSSILNIDETAAVLAYLQQSVTGLVSACQRLLPLGQGQASAILWRLKPVLISMAEASAIAVSQGEDCAVFTPLLDIGSMRHPNLPTRLFIS